MQGDGEAQQKLYLAGSWELLLGLALVWELERQVNNSSVLVGVEGRGCDVMWADCHRGSSVNSLAGLEGGRGWFGHMAVALGKAVEA